MSAMTAAAAPPRTLNPIERFPLSPLQEGMLFHYLRDPRSGDDIEIVVLYFDADLDAARLQAAWQQASERYDVLQAAFTWERSRPLHTVQAGVRVPFSFEDRPGLRTGERADYVEACVRAERCAGFVLEHAPLQRVRMIRFAPTEHVVIWTNHHAILDGRARTLVLRDIFDAYAGRPWAPAGAPYRAHVDALERRDAAAHEDFWRTYLAGITATTPLPVSSVPRPAQPAERTLVAQRRLDRATTAALGAFARAHATSINVVLQAAWALLLARHAGISDVVFGAVRAGRHDRRATMVGLLINTLPVRVTVDEEATLLAFVRQVHAQWHALRAVEHTPLSAIVAWSELPPKCPLFESLVVYEREPLERTVRATIDADGALGLRGARIFDQTTAALTLAAAGTQALELRLQADTRRYASADVARLAEQLIQLLRGFARDPGGRVRDLSLLTGAERRRVLAFNRTMPYPRDATIPELFAAQVALRPDAAALQLGDATLSYRALAARSDAVAVALQARGVTRGDFVGVCVDRSFDMLAALLGILKVGAASLAVDPTHPAKRVAAMLGEAAVAIVLTQRHLAAALAPALGLPAAAGARSMELEAIAGEPSHAPRDAGVRADDAAHVMYTSGSTGTPKGAILPHRAVIRTVCGTDYLRFAPDETFFAFVPLTFDVMALELWGPLLNGARLVLCPPGLPSLDALARTIRTQGVTTLWLTTALFEQMVDEQLDQLTGLHQLIVGGDVMSPAHARRALAALPRARILNVCGPTEATVLITAQVLQEPLTVPIPLGAPIPNAAVYVLDPWRRPVPVGVPGEIYTGDDGLALGYLNDPQRTAESFVPDPFSPRPGARMYRTGDLARWRDDGAIEFLGRVDVQVKIRGLRIELGAIESVLTDHPAVREAVVIPTGGSSSERELAAYVVARDGRLPCAVDVQAFVAARLPAQMVPAYVFAVDRIPRTPTGKFDRKALPDPAALRAQAATVDERERELPLTAAEITVAAHVATTLGVDDVRLDDDFDALGGNSLRAMRLVSRLREAFCVDLTVLDLIGAPTVRGITARIESLDRRADAQPTARIRALRAEGSGIPVVYLHGDLAGGGAYCAELVRSIDVAHPFYVIAPHGTDGRAVPASIEAMADDNVSQLWTLVPPGPIVLAGFCNGGMVAYEMARRLAEAGVRVQHVTIIDGTTANVGLPPHVAARRRLRHAFARLRTAATRPAGDRWSDWHDRLVDDMNVALGRYIPGPYAGNVSLLWSDERSAAEAALATARWQRIAPAATADRVPGSHLTSVTRQLAETARVLARHVAGATHADWDQRPPRRDRLHDSLAHSL